MSDSHKAKIDFPVQFDLRHIFFLTLLVAIAVALGRAAGVIAPVLIIGIAVEIACLGILKIENTILGGYAGAAIAFGIAVLAVFAFNGMELASRIACLIVYPLIGYVVGILDSAGRAISAGL